MFYINLWIVAENVFKVFKCPDQILSCVRCITRGMYADFVAPGSELLIELTLLGIHQRNRFRSKKITIRGLDPAPLRPNLTIFRPIGPKRKNSDGKFKTKLIEGLEEGGETPAVCGIGVVNDGEGEIIAVGIQANLPWLLGKNIG